MKKLSARRKLASNLLGRGLSSLGKTLKTPVSQLTGKQKLLGALGAGAGVAGSSVAAAKFGLGELLANLQHSNLLEEANSLRGSLGPGLGEGTQAFLNDIKSMSTFSNTRIPAGAEARGIISDIEKIKNTGWVPDASGASPSARISSFMEGPTRRYAETSRMLGGITDRNARGIQSMLMGRYYLTPPSLSEAVGSAVPGVGIYQDFTTALGNAALRESLTYNPDVVARINELAAQPFAGAQSKVKALSAALGEGQAYAEKYTKALENYKTLQELNPRLEAPNPYLRYANEAFNKAINPIEAHTQGIREARGTIDYYAYKLKSMREKAKALRDLLPTAEFDTGKITQADRALDGLMQSKGISTARDIANQRVGEYSRYANIVLPEEATLARSSFLDPGASVNSALKGTAVSAGKDAAMEQLAKALISKTVGKTLAGAAAPALAVGKGIGGGINYLVNEGQALSRLIDSARAQIGPEQFDKLYKELLEVSSGRAAELQTQYGKELLEELAKRTAAIEQVSRMNRIAGAKL